MNYEYESKIPFSFYSSSNPAEDIDCLILVIDYIKVEGDINTWDSDLDYYGYEEIEYILSDHEGNGLQVEISEKVDSLIRETIREYYRKEFLREDAEYFEDTKGI